jgi:hypothetical protein
MTMVPAGQPSSKIDGEMLSPQCTPDQLAVIDHLKKMLEIREK